MEDNLKRIKEAADIVDKLYQNKWFTDLSRDKRVEKVNEVLMAVSAVNDISNVSNGFGTLKGEDWDEEKRKDNPHHHTNRLD